MALLTPQSTDLLSAKDHARMHRVIDQDEAATEGVLSIDSSDNLNYGSGTVDCGAFVMTKGAQSGTPTVTMALSSDANGDFSITTDTGDITLSSSDDIILIPDDANSDNITISGNASDLFVKWSDGSLKLMTDEATNTQSTVEIIGKGSGNGALYIQDGAGVNGRMTTIVGATNVELDFGSNITEYVVNQAGADVDYRIESDNQPHAFYIDAGNDKVGIVKGTWVAGSYSRDFNVVAAGASPGFGMACFSSTTTHGSYIELRKSASGTMGTKTETGDGDVLGTIDFEGVDTGSNFDEGARIKAIQDGAAGVNIPTNIVMSTWSATAENANQLVLHNDGRNAFGTNAPDGIVEIENSTTTVPLLLIDANGTTGATGQAVVRIDSENTDVAAVYITGATDASGTDAKIDDSVLCVVAEGVGGVAYFHRNVSAASSHMITINEDNVDATASQLYITTDQDASANSASVQLVAANAAYDQPVLQITQAGTGNGVKVTTAVGTATGLNFDLENTSANGIYTHCDVLTTGTCALFSSDSSDDSTRSLVKIVNDNTSAVGTTPLTIKQDAPTSTNFKKLIVLDSLTIWISDGTTAEGALTGVEGDICLNGGTGGGQMAFCDASGQNWTDM